jgi:hypothetical protein
LPIVQKKIVLFEHKNIIYLKQLCTIYNFIFNNIYIIIIPTCLDTVVPSSGSLTIVRG